MRLKILVIADARIPVPPVGYGGTERIVDLLCRGLVERGHAVRLMAAAGSGDYLGTLFPHVTAGPGIVSRAYRKLLFQPLCLVANYGVDAVVSFGRPDYLRYLYRTKRPLVLVFQNPLDQKQIDEVLKFRQRDIKLVGISRNQIDGLAPPGLLEVIYNGIDESRFVVGPPAARRSDLVFLGRITPNKGVHLAIQAALQANCPLKIAGEAHFNEPGVEDYFRREIEPHLGSQIQLIGAVDDSQKASLLSNAKALLFPIQWPEPFGIVQIEAMASGCPVIGWANGSVPEVIEHGVTGFIVDSLENMVAAINRVNEIDRQVCRRIAVDRFGSDRMVDQYLRVINSCVSQH